MSCLNRFARIAHNVELRTVEAWTNDKEPYRVKLRYMLQKLQNMREERVQGNEATLPYGCGFNSRTLKLIDRSLRHHFADLRGEHVLEEVYSPSRTVRLPSRSAGCASA